ncbi:Tn3 family transposase [Streptomyces sp. NPDC055036]
MANATFAARSEAVWGQGTTTVASDSTHFKAWDRNIFTEWHSRYGGRGVLVYWHIEKGSMAIHSQLLNCTASEVAAAIEGMMRHATTMQAEGNYVDSHGQSEIGFGLTRLLGYDLLPRIKQINKVKLYRPGREDEDSYERLADAMTRPIRWDVIENNYDQLIKYATAIRVGTASTEAILRRFTRTASHPVYQAMLEVGRAQKTIFVARYLRDRDLQREIQEGLNVVEGWNGANDIIFFGKSGELSSNRRDQQELSVLALHLLQTALVFVFSELRKSVAAPVVEGHVWFSAAVTVRPAMSRNAGMPRFTVAARRFRSPSSASFCRAPARLTLSPSTSPSQPSRSASAMRSSRLSRISTMRPACAGSGRRRLHLRQLCS